MEQAARTLPAGFRASVWPELDPAGRALLLEEFQIINPNLELRGAVDFQSTMEPVLFDRQSGDRVSLAGEVVSSGDGGLTVPIFEGTVMQGNTLTVLLIVGGLAAAIVASRI